MKNLYTKPTKKIKDILDYEGLYAITEDGEIWSYPKNWRNKELKILAQSETRGYKKVTLCKDGIHKDFRVHKLVGITYLPNPENKPFINHKNGIKTDNRVENLEWCTPKENAQHSYYILGKKQKKEHLINFIKSGNDFCKKVAQIDDNGNILNIFESGRAAGKFIGKNFTGISMCAHGKIKKFGGYSWRILPN